MNNTWFMIVDTVKPVFQSPACFIITVKPVNKGHPWERQNMVFIDKWSLFEGYFVFFYQGRVIEVWPLFTGWSLFGGGLKYRLEFSYILKY